MMKVQLAEFWQRSTAVQVTTVLPQGKVEPDGGLQKKVTTPLLSEAMGGR